MPGVSHTHRLSSDVVVILNKEILPSESVDTLIRRLLGISPSPARIGPLIHRASSEGEPLILRHVQVSEEVLQTLTLMRLEGENHDSVLRRLLKLPATYPASLRKGSIGRVIAVGEVVELAVTARQLPNESWSEALHKLLTKKR